jgi:ribosome-associated protein
LIPKTIAKRAAEYALSKKAYDVNIMDLRELTDMTDFFVVCSADSDVQVKAIADAVVEGMEKRGVAVWHQEGLSQRQWVLLDYVDVVVHIFHKNLRRFYSLEKLWGDAKIETIADDAPVTRAESTPRRRVARAK